MRTALVLLVASLATMPLAHATHSAPATESQLLDGGRGGLTWRSVAFAPTGDHALLAGSWSDGERTRDVVARWTAGGGLEEVYNRSGSGLVDVAFHPSGTSLVVGLRNTLLLGTPASYVNVWNASEFHGRGLDFYGLRGAWRPGADTALVAGSSLLRMDIEGELTVIHGGRGAFFRATDWNPTAPFALVEAAIEREDRALLGAVWRTNGSPPLGEADNVAVYGRFTPGAALLNTIDFAPNGSFALLAGRDGAGASFLTWSSHRIDCHPHEDTCHDHRWQYLPTNKREGPVTCAAWHPSGRYALVGGLQRDVVGFANTHLYVPTLHQGPDLHGCAFHPSGAYALAVGAEGTVLHVAPGAGPLGAVITPEAGSLTPPAANASFLVGVLERTPGEDVEVSGHVQAQAAAAPVVVVEQRPWWRLDVNTTALRDGTHHLVVNVTTAAGTTSFRHAFLLNNERFTPERPTLRAPGGLEGAGTDSNGRFEIRWELLDQPVVYEVQERLAAGGTDVSRVYQAGSADNLTVQVTEDGSYLYRVRAKNAFNASAWSEGVVINVILDSDGDGVPDSKDPRPFIYDEWSDSDGDGINDDVEYLQCSDPHRPESTPTSDDDGDGVPNGVECRQGSDPLDPNDPGRPDGNDDDGDNGDEHENGSPAPALVLVIGALALAALRRRR